MIKILFILSLVLLFILLKHQEKFLNPNTILKKGNIKDMRELRKCNPSDVNCVLSKRSLIKRTSIRPPKFTRRVNYLVSHDVRHLLPAQKQVRVLPNF